MSYSRRQLEALGEPFGSCATRVKPGGYGRIYGVGNEPEPEGSRPSGEDYYYQTGTTGSGPYGGQPAGFMVANPEYKGAEYVPYTGEGVPSGDDYYYNRGSLGAPAGYMVANPEYQADVPAYVPYVAPTTTAVAADTVGPPAPTTTTSTSSGGGGRTVGGNPIATNVPNLTIGPPVITDPRFTYIDPNADKAGPPAPVGNLPVVQVPVPVPVPVPQQQVGAPPTFLGTRPPFTGVRNPFYEGSDTRSDLVNMAYQRLLNRPPDEAGLAHYSQEMTRGLTGQGLVSALANSPEFQRTQDFQRAYTSTFRPGYQEFGPSGQYSQPIYLSSYTDYARSPGFTQPMYNTAMMTPQDLGYGFGSFNPFAYGGTNPFAGEAAAQTSEGTPAAASGGRIKDDDGITALLEQ